MRRIKSLAAAFVLGVILSLGATVAAAQVERAHTDTTTRAQKYVLSEDIDTTNVAKVFSTLPALIPFKQPAIYEQWWKELALCENIYLPPEHVAVRFLVVNSTALFTLLSDGDELYGASFQSEIVLSMQSVLTQSVVKHEMGHYLLTKAGFKFGPYHPAEFFDVCGLKPGGG